MEWFGVRSHYRYAEARWGEVVYEERVVIFQAENADAAFAVAEAEAEAYLSGEPDAEVLPHMDAFRLFDAPDQGAEVYSLMRTSALPSDEYLTRFFYTGTERSSELD